MATMPDRINIDKTDRGLYKKLDGEEFLKFKDSGGKRTRKEQFFFAMAIGFKNNIKRPLNTKEGFFLIKDLLPTDETLINAVAINDYDSVETLANKGEVFKIAEEYAHAGIRLLVDKIEFTEFGKFEKKLEQEIFEIYNKIGLKNG
jgi:hypothetical protein